MQQRFSLFSRFDLLLDWKLWFIPVLLSVFLIFSSFYNYLLFHTLAEFFTIMIGVLMFVVALYTYTYARDNFLLYLAVGYFWIAGIDMVHALIYEGMTVFGVGNANHATQFWIADRYLESLLLFSAPFFLSRRFHAGYTFSLFGFIAVSVYVVIMNGYFPDAFIEGTGLTPFKIISEYIICVILILAMMNLYTHRHKLREGVFPFLSISIVLTICAELAFTNYVSLYGLSNLVGHIFKLFSFWFVFYSIILHSLKLPYESLQTTSSLLTALRDGIPDLIFYKDKKGVFLGCNQSFCDFVGKESEFEIIGMTDYDLCGKEQANFFRDKDVEVLKDGIPKRNDEWGTYPDGKRVLFDTLKAPLQNTQGHVIGLIGICRDITERKQLEERSRIHIKHLESMQQIADAVSSALTPDDMLESAVKTIREVFASDRAWLLYSCDPDADYWEVLVESTSLEYPGAFELKQKFPMSPEVRQLMHDALNSLKSVVCCPMPHLGVDVDQFTVRSQMVIAIRPKFGKPWLFGLHQCSYERVWSDEERELFETVAMKVSDILCSTYLNHDLKKLSQAVQQTGEAVLITDQHAVIEYVNPAFTKITGYALEEVAGKALNTFKNSAQDASFHEDVWSAITHGEAWSGTLIDQRKDGSFYPAMMSISPICNDSGEITHYVSLQQDMSEYQKLEKKFLQAQKMEAIGTLVGGIAHDFNNVLAAIQGNIYLSKRKLKNQPEVSDKLNDIEILGKRAAEMIKQLLTFARKGKVEMSDFSFNFFIKEAYKLGKTAIPESIELVCDCCPEALTVHGDATQLQQALMNLLNNARDAVSGIDQPRISCELSAFTATDEFKKTHPNIYAVNFARLTIKDNGCGIAEGHLNKVFEPFFTTKEVGKGTGLGLAMVYGAVQSHGGILEIESELGVGSVFDLYLPAKKEIKDQKKEKDKKTTVSQGQGEMILLVDDEDTMRRTTAEVLHSLGYRVLKAVDGEQGLDIFKHYQDEIALIITDVVMPKMGGVAFANTVWKLNQDIPIIFATGYDKENTMTITDELNQGVVMNKPFTFDVLSQSIRRLIDSNV